MKLHRLELEGFGPFAARQAVDFDAFDDDGIFLISGRTGAGKSSVLDGVSFALFGSVPRYSGGEKRLRSDYCAPDAVTEVRLEFTVGSTRWRVTRSPEYERLKARGTGMTKVAAAALLEEHVSGGWVGRAARAREVAHLLEEILGLTHQQFLQVILLAQNRFADFLLAGNDDRQALLRTLFGSRTYVDYRTALETRRKASEQALERSGHGVEILLDEAEVLIEVEGMHGTADEPPGEGANQLGQIGVEARIAAAERAIDRARYRAETLQEERDRAETEHARAASEHGALTTLRARQVDRARARDVLADLERDEAEITGQRRVREAARRAESLRGPILAATRAAAAAAEAHARAVAAFHEWTTSGEVIGAGNTLDEGSSPLAGFELSMVPLRPLEDRVDELTGDLARAVAAADHERALADYERAFTALTTQAGAAARESEEVAALRATIPARLDDLDRAAAPLEGVERALETARADLLAATAAHAAAEQAAQLSAALREAEVDYAARIADSESARRTVTALLRRRLDGHAGELAATLTDGEPCMVCGALEHPRPAPQDADPVTDEDFTRSERERDAAAEAERAAADAARRAREALADARLRAGGADLEDAGGRLTAAQTAVAVATDQVAERARLDAERDDLRAQRADVERRHDALTTTLTDLQRALAVTTERLETARGAVDEARGGFASVAERIAGLTARRDLGRDLVAALHGARAADDVLRDAEADRDARIAASDFADAAAVSAALRDDATRAAIDERVRVHEIAFATARDRLRDLEVELAGVPDELIDLEDSLSRVSALRERWNTAVVAAQSALHSADTLASLIARVRNDRGAAAALAADHAVVAGLADAVSGRNAARMDLETFVLAAELEDIVQAANLRLDDMSAGRYRLAHTDARAARNAASGLGLEIVDAYTGRSRPAQSLSGGETFLASLALALGLAEVVTARAGGVRLDTLFVDEGFGSLDTETLELAMRTLDELRQGGRTVGVISHVEAMKEQIPAQLLITSTPGGPSVIRQADVSV